MQSEYGPEHPGYMLSLRREMEALSHVSETAKTGQDYFGHNADGLLGEDTTDIRQKASEYKHQLITLHQATLGYQDPNQLALRPPLSFLFDQIDKFVPMNSHRAILMRPLPSEKLVQADLVSARTAKSINARREARNGIMPLNTVVFRRSFTDPSTILMIEAYTELLQRQPDQTELILNGIPHHLEYNNLVQLALRRNGILRLGVKVTAPHIHNTYRLFESETVQSKREEIDITDTQLKELIGKTDPLLPIVGPRQMARIMLMLEHNFQDK